MDFICAFIYCTNFSITIHTFHSKTLNITIPTINLYRIINNFKANIRSIKFRHGRFRSIGFMFLF